MATELTRRQANTNSHEVETTGSHTLLPYLPSVATRVSQSSDMLRHAVKRAQRVYRAAADALTEPDPDENVPVAINKATSDTQVEPTAVLRRSADAARASLDNTMDQRLPPEPHTIQITAAPDKKGKPLKRPSRKARSIQQREVCVCLCVF